MDLYENKRSRKLARRDLVAEHAPFRLLPRGGGIRRRLAGS
jgi:hypothetical protein